MNLPPTDPSCRRHVRREFFPQIGRVGVREIDLVGDAVESECHCLGCFPAIQIIFKTNQNLLRLWYTPLSAPHVILLPCIVPDLRRVCIH